MRLDARDIQASQSDERRPQQNDSEHSLMTPARRAALDALEREFRDLLKSAAR